MQESPLRKKVSVLDADNPLGWIDDPRFPPLDRESYTEHFNEKMAKDSEKANEEALYFFSRMSVIKDETGVELYVNKNARVTPVSPCYEDYLEQEDFDGEDWEWIHEPLYLDFSEFFENGGYAFSPVENTWFLQIPSFHSSILADEPNVSTSTLVFLMK